MFRPNKVVSDEARIPVDGLTDREQRFMKKSWASVFATEIFPRIREERFAVLFSEKLSRPNTPVNVLVGAQIIKEMFGLTDDELLENILFDSRYQCALHTLDCKEQPLSDRSLGRFRQKLAKHQRETGVDLLGECVMEDIGIGLASLAQEMGEAVLRMDSMMIEANISHLSRLGLIYQCVAGLVRQDAKNGVPIAPEMSHYLDKNEYNRIFYHKKRVGEKMDSTADMLFADAEALLANTEGGRADTEAYRNLRRCLDEQTIVDVVPDKGTDEAVGQAGDTDGQADGTTEQPANPDGQADGTTEQPANPNGQADGTTEQPANPNGQANGAMNKTADEAFPCNPADPQAPTEVQKKRRLRTTEDGGMHSGMLQNPSDPDATYREKAGEEHRGYVLNFLELVVQGFSAVIAYELKPNNYSDAQFLANYLQSVEPFEKRIILVCDGAYYSEENRRLAITKNIELVTTALTGRSVDIIHAEFKWDESETRVLKCPVGYEPIRCSAPTATGQITLSMARSQCETCPHMEQCKANLRKRVSHVRVSNTSHHRALLQKSMDTERMRNLTRIRNGVETVPSTMRRKYHVDRMPVRRLPRTRIFVGAKIAALDVRKLVAYRRGICRYARNPMLKGNVS